MLGLNKRPFACLLCATCQIEADRNCKIQKVPVGLHWFIAYMYRGDCWNDWTLITAPGSVSNEPGSVTWLATKYFKTVSWRNHTEKLTTLWSQNTSFWPKINIPSSHLTILMLNCLENTLFLTAMWQLSNSWPNQFSKQLDLTQFQHCWDQSRF